MSALPTVLVIDDEVRSVEALERILEDDFDVKKATSTTEAEAILNEEAVQVVLCDQRMPGMSGVDFLKIVRERWPEVGAHDHLGLHRRRGHHPGRERGGHLSDVTKPWQPDSLALTLKNAVRLYKLQRENELLAIELKMSTNRAEKVVANRRQGLRETYEGDDGIVRDRNSPMNDVCARMRRVAPTTLRCSSRASPAPARS